MSLNKFKTAIYNQISSFVTCSEYKTLSNVTYPYVVYNLSFTNTRNEGYLQNVLVECDVWDFGNDSIRIDNLRDTFYSRFKNFLYHDESISVKISSIDSLSIPDPDQNLIRKRIRLNFIYHNKTL